MNAIPDKAHAAAREPPPLLASLPTTELVSLAANRAVELVRKEMELARVEIKEDIRAEVRAARVMGFAGLCAVCAVSLLLVAVALTLAEVMLPWAAALVVALVVAGVGALAAIGAWTRRVREPLDVTRQTLKENVQWAHRRLS